jgi:hypothetical protein
MEKKTFQQFFDESAASLARLAARGIRASGVGRRVTSVRPSVIMSRAERGETWKGVGAKQELAAKINPKSKLYEPSTTLGYRSVSRYDKTKTNISGGDIRSRNITTARSAAKKAGFKGGSAKNRFDYAAKDKSYTTYPTDRYGDGFSHPKSNTQIDTNITTIPSGRKAALSSLPKITVPVRRAAGSRASYRVPSTNEIARKMKEFRRRIVKTGGQERNPVHTVDFIPRRDESGNYGEMDKHAMKVGRNFIKAQRNLAKELKKAGANQGDVVSGGPAAMRTGENTIVGKKRRARMYKKTYGDRVTDLDPTGRVKYMIGAVGGDIKK